MKTPPAGLLRRGQSPTKSTAKTENLLSPWRIRVTVEAERDEDKPAAGGRAGEKVGRSVTKKGTGRTTTTLVPLKGLEESSPPPASRRSARSRKSDVGSSPIKGGGVAALVRKRGRRMTFGEDDAGRDLSVGATPGKRGRGRPRKSLPLVDGEDVVMMEAERLKLAVTAPARNARGKRKAISPVNVAVDADLDGDLFDRKGKRLVRNGSVALGETSPNRSLSASPRKGVSAVHSIVTALPKTTQPSSSSRDASQQDLNSAEKEMRRSATPSHSGQQPPRSTAVGDDDSIRHNQAMLADPTNDHREFDSILESEGFSMVSLESIESARQNLSNLSQQAIRSQAKSTKNFLTDPALHPPSLGDDVPRPDTPPAADAMQRSRVASTGQEASLRGGSSMVLDAGLQYPNSGVLRNTSSPHQPKDGSGKTVSFSAQNDVIGPDSSNTSARQASVPTGSPREKQPVQQKTPLQLQPTPKKPPPIQQAAPPNSSDPTSKRKRDTPKLSRVVRTAIALQGVLDNTARETNLQGSSLRSPYVSPADKGSSNNLTGKSPKERLDDLFEGFGPGTRRELRAGLRLGEELARRHKLAAQAQQVDEPSGVVASEDDVFTAANDMGYPKLPTPEDKDDYAPAAPVSAPQQAIEHPRIQPEQLLSPERSEREEDEMDWQVDTPLNTQNLNSSDTVSDQDTLDETVADSFTRGREAQWQREREAISRQIQMANSSQVIVINSDDSEAVKEPETLRDENHNALDAETCQVEASSADQTRASPSIDGDLFPDEVAQPRRGKIPSPWRRDSQMVYSDEATEDPSALFWQPDQRAIQLAKEREERKRRKENHLETESKADDIYDNEAEAEAAAEGASQTTSDDEPPTKDSEPANTNPDRLLAAYQTLIRKARTNPSAPQPTHPTTWLSKLTNITSTFLWDTPDPTDTWSNAEYHLLDALYQRAKTDATICPYNPNGGLWGFRICLGRTLLYGNYSLKITKSHLGIADAFREKVRLASLNIGGDGKVEWSEYYVVKRLFSLMVGEDMRRRGIPFPEREGDRRGEVT